MKQTAYRAAACGIVIITSASAVHAAVLTNGNFENTVGWGAVGTTDFPAGWSYATSAFPDRKNAAAQQSGSNAIGGNGTSAYMSSFTSSDNTTRREIAQSFSALTGDFYLDFDFASEDPGGAGDRSLSVTLGSTASGTPFTILGLRVVDADGDGDGDVETFGSVNGTTGLGWTSVAALNSSVVFDSDVQTTPLVHHFSLAFNNSTGLYSVTITDSNGGVKSATGLNIFAAAASSRDPTRLEFNTFNSAGDYLIDNVRLEASPVPEPATTAAIGVGLASVLRRRRF